VTHVSQTCFVIISCGVIFGHLSLGFQPVFQRVPTSAQQFPPLITVFQRAHDWSFFLSHISPVHSFPLYCSPIFVCVLWVISTLEALKNVCVLFSSLPCMLHAMSSVIVIISPCLARSTHYKVPQFVVFSSFLLILFPKVVLICVLPTSHTQSIVLYCESYGVIHITRWSVTCMWWVTPIYDPPCNWSFVSFNLYIFRLQIERQQILNSRIQSTVNFTVNIILIFHDYITLVFQLCLIFRGFICYVIIS
jgi:hypothetical protein